MPLIKCLKGIFEISMKYELTEGFRVKIELEIIKSKGTMLQKWKGFNIAMYFLVMLLTHNPLLHSARMLFGGLSCLSTDISIAVTFAFMQTSICCAPIFTSFSLMASQSGWMP